MKGIFIGHENFRYYPWLVSITDGVVSVVDARGLGFRDNLEYILKYKDEDFVPGYRQFVLSLLKKKEIINYKGDL